jgi:4-hydroxybutyrate CoA-transferase
LEKIKAEDIPHIIGPKAKVGVGNACAEPQTVVDILVQQKDRFESLEIYGMILYWSERFVRHHLEDRFKLKSFMVDRFTLEGIKRGTVEYIPCRYSQIPGLFLKGIIPLDVALVSLSPPNSRGNCSFGVSSDFTLAMAKSAETVIAEINQQMPWVHGGSFMNVNEIDYVIESDRVLPQVPRAALREKDRQIGKYAAKLIDDGATIQIGIGRLSEGVLSCLHQKKRLGVHSGLLPDGVVDLVERGVVDNSCKGLKNGKIVTTTMVGTDKLFQFVDHNRAVESYPSEKSIDCTP